MLTLMWGDSYKTVHTHTCKEAGSVTKTWYKVPPPGRRTSQMAHRPVYTTPSAASQTERRTCVLS